MNDLSDVVMMMKADIHVLIQQWLDFLSNIDVAMNSAIVEFTSELCFTLKSLCVHDGKHCPLVCFYFNVV